MPIVASRIEGTLPKKRNAVYSQLLDAEDLESKPATAVAKAKAVRALTDV